MTINQEIESKLAENDHVSVFRMLDENPEVIDEQIAPGNTFTYLIEACRRRYDTIATGLLERGADVNRVNAVDENGEGGNAPLWFACQGPAEGNRDLLMLLIKAGAQLDSQGESGWTPLHMACQWLHVDLAELLLEAGASPDIRDSEGRTPLEYAKEKVDDMTFMRLKRVFN
ncbi:MAG: ankyrin repeat domain-containing protein [Candidatus Latescibacteria bacterium]|nr:ankyrin repeat domain-containing protein [Candidatus Latescibacterota bacterium]